MRKVWTPVAAVASLVAASSSPALFEARPRVVAEGAYPQVAVRASGTISLLSVSRGDLWYRSSNDGGDSFETAVRVNETPGEVAAHAENSPQLVLRSRSELYCLWQARREGASPVLRFARSTDWGESFAQPIEVAPPAAGGSQGFYSMQVSPKGTIYTAWLDSRDRGEVRSGTAAVYLARSLNRGASFEPAVRVALDACPCCRPSIAITDERTVHVSLRKVLDNDVRDMEIATSTDAGATWGAPVRVAEDLWKINGCPHSGASMAVLGKRLFVAWHTVRGRVPALYVAWSDDQGRTFSPGLQVADGVLDANHPFLQAAEDKIGIVFQGRPADGGQGWEKIDTYYRELSVTGRLSPLMVLGHASASVSYPTLIYDLPGKLFAAWTESNGSAPQIVFDRGREMSAERRNSRAN